MQVYTRTGDAGQTRLIGGAQVAKDAKRITAYGTIDELNSTIGICAAHAQQQAQLDPDQAALWLAIREELTQIQSLTFDCGNDVATPHGVYDYRLKQEFVDWLEERIDEYTEGPPAIHYFIIPGGTVLASHLHSARTIARRAERSTITFMREEPGHPIALKFLNRLSDYFFALARYANWKSGVEDIPYTNGEAVFHDITKDDLENL